MKIANGREMNISRTRKIFDPAKYPDVKPWVVAAIIDEEKRPNELKWRNEPTAEYQHEVRLRRIKFLRKWEGKYPELKAIADRLELCAPRRRCFSGACPECGRLFQRFYVRQTRRLVRDVIAPAGKQLIAICIVPSSPLVRAGELHKFSIENFQRRIKSACDAADAKYAIGGVDFSFNEDREHKWQPFICPHIYLISSVDDRDALLKRLKKSFNASAEIDRPIKLPRFENNARRRSYSLKFEFKRRISYFKLRKDGKTKGRDTSNDRLRAAERVELYRHLNQIGLAARVLFRGIKPKFSSSKVRFFGKREDVSANLGE